MAWDAGTGWQMIGGANLTGTSYTNTGVTGGTRYSTIRAVNAGGGTSGWLGAGTNAYTSVTASQGVPAGETSTVSPTPTTAADRLSTPPLTATAAEGGVALSWGAVRYELREWDRVTDCQQLGDGNPADTSFTHGRLEAALLNDAAVQKVRGYANSPACLSTRLA